MPRSPEPRRTILHVITDLDVGGAERMLTNYASSERTDGTVPVVCSLMRPGAMALALRERAVSVHDLGVDHGSPLRLLQLLRAVWRLRALIRRERPEAVVGWMYHANLVALIATWSTGHRTACRLYAGIRCSAMAAENYPLLFRLVVMGSRACSGRYDAVIYNSAAGRDEHAALGFKPRRTHVARNGIDTGRFRPNADARQAVRQELGIAPDTPLMVVAARVDPMKDHDGFLNAFERLGGGAEALLVGLDTDNDTKISPRPGVHRLGIRQDMPSVYAAADFLVMSSAFGEGFPNVVAEGMACGLIPIVTNVGDASDIVGDLGWVVPARDPAALADALGAALALSKDEQSARRMAVRDRVVTVFSLESACRQMDRAIGLITDA